MIHPPKHACYYFFYLGGRRHPYLYFGDIKYNVSVCVGLHAAENENMYFHKNISHVISSLFLPGDNYLINTKKILFFIIFNHRYI